MTKFEHGEFLAERERERSDEKLRVETWRLNRIWSQRIFFVIFSLPERNHHPKAKFVGKPEGMAIFGIVYTEWLQVLSTVFFFCWETPQFFNSCTLSGYEFTLISDWSYSDSTFF